jgi:hypothetical protein
VILVQRERRVLKVYKDLRVILELQVPRGRKAILELLELRDHKAQQDQQLMLPLE